MLWINNNINKVLLDNRLLKNIFVRFIYQEVLLWLRSNLITVLWWVVTKYWKLFYWSFKYYYYWSYSSWFVSLYQLTTSFHEIKESQCVFVEIIGKFPLFILTFGLARASDYLVHSWVLIFVAFTIDRAFPLQLLWKINCR